MTTFKTPKGTELPILSLRGKEYLEVKYRLVWFREEHPDWSIETEIVYRDKDSAGVKATIKDDKGRVISMSHKCEDTKGFPDFLEKAETGAIGRALALCGFGTQFCADELDEAERIVDAPAERKGKVENKKPSEPKPAKASNGEVYLIDLGKDSKLTGTRIADHEKEFLKSVIQGKFDWYEKQKREVHPNVIRLSEEFHKFWSNPANQEPKLKDQGSVPT